MHLNPRRTGMAVGTFVGLVKLVWAILVALNAGQGLMDFMMRTEMVRTSVMVLPFDLGNAILLVIVGAIVGYILGWVFASIWNRSHAR